MKIQILGAHNCESKSTKLVSLLIDDVLAIDAGALTSSLSFEAQQKIKAILLTHQHYDHIRDIPALGMNALFHKTTISVYSIQAVYDTLATYLLNGEVYSKFLEKPDGEPIIKFTVIVPNKVTQIEGYSLLTVPVNHSVPTVGYQITAPDGKILFYTGDTGPGLADCWQHVSPQMLITEVTAPDRYEESARELLHLTPNLLKQELEQFRKTKGYLPQVFLVHMNPAQEEEIEAEIAAASRSLNNPVRLVREGMLLHL